MKDSALSRKKPLLLCLTAFLILSFIYLVILFKILDAQPSSIEYQDTLGTITYEPPLYSDTLSERDELRTLIPSSNDLEAYIKEMTLEEKVGQMLMGGVFSAQALNEQIKMVQSDNLGGIILMGPSVVDPETTLTTFSKLDSLKKDIEIPILIAIDEEGGTVTRLRDQLSPQTPQLMIKDNITAYNVGLTKGTQLHYIGINTNFAPVLDHATDPNSFLYDRCFHAPQQQIAELGTSMIRGFKEAGMIAVPKHYPGHPDNITDSHFEVPVSNIKKEDFNSYAEQFRLIALNGSADMMMSGHILFPKIDKDISSLSSKILTDILRNEYGYEGVIITDDMNMGAITKNLSTGDAAVKAINAGNDILLYVAGPDIQEIAYRSVISAVNNGVISEERIDQSVARILGLKIKYLGWEY